MDVWCMEPECGPRQKGTRLSSGLTYRFQLSSRDLVFRLKTIQLRVDDRLFVFKLSVCAGAECHPVQTGPRQQPFAAALP
jgi:hypothetical protein